MALTMSSVEKLREISKSLSDDNVKKIVLVGEPGVGKTWMAKKSSDRAIRDRVFDITLWVFLCRKYDSRALCESFARQLCILSTSDEWEVEDEIKEEEKNWENIKHTIRAALSGKMFLLILDDEGSKMNEEQIMSELEALLPSDLKFSYKVLITRANNISDHIPDGTTIEVKPLPEQESWFLLRERTETAAMKFPGTEILAKAFIEKSRGVPSEIIVIAKALSYFGQHDSGVRKLERALEETSDTEKYNVLQLLCSECDLFPVGVLIDCCWRGSHFFRECGSVHYNELITYWILEGYLGDIDIEKAYEKGHRVLMELIDCRILKTLELGHVNVPVLNLYNCQLRGFGGTASLGLASVFDGEWKGLGRITQKDGMIKTLRKGKKGQNLSTSLLDGNHYAGEVLINFLQSEKELQVLALFNPSLESLPPPLSSMSNLRVLLLRGCDFMKDINLTLDLKLLTALEISGSSSLKEIPDGFFKDLTQLRSLNLSELQIKILPSSLYSLGELRWLILRGCSQLEKLEALTKLTNLMVLDISAATSLNSISDKTFSKNQKLQMINLSETQIKTLPFLRNLGELTHLLLSGCTQLDRLRSITSLTNLKVLDISGATRFKELHDPSLENLGHLEILDLSETSVDQIPSNISNPLSLYLKGCYRLKQLPFMEGLKDLKVLDVSGSTKLDEIGEEFFKHLTCLRVLNLSETNVNELPPLSSLCNLRQLLLSRCVSLVKLPELNSLEKLEVLDLSHCCALTKIQDKSLEHMSRLQRLDLSETKIECLPPLSNPSNLRHLLLKKCTNLKKLPLRNSLLKLEELNLSGISFLRETGADFVEDMTSLQILNLSETLLECLPSMKNLKNLNHLSLRGCTQLETVPNLEELTKLVVLDLSGTAVRHLPLLNNFSNLRQLLLRDCSRMEEFRHLETSDLLWPTVHELPYAISDLTHLEVLDPPNMKNIEGADTRETVCPQEELNQHLWIISSWPAEGLTDSDRHGISVTSTQCIEHLEKYPSLWARSFKRFHFLVHPIEAHNTNGYRYSYRNDLIFRDIYFQTIQFVHHMQRERSLEIRGFHSFPKGVEGVLRHAEFVFLIDNPFIKWLSDLGVDNVKDMKVCWIERCTKLESLFHIAKLGETAEEIPTFEKDADMGKFGNNLEIIRVSDAVSLKNIFSGNLQGNNFKNLKCFYLDYCPKLSNVFSSSQGLENLEVLQIKFCNELETLFEHESAALPKLRTLHLWSLPRLKKVGCVVPVLQSLRVGECPMLVNVISSSQLPENLEILQIKFCNELETVIEHNTSMIYTLHKLCILHMWELPKLKNIGAELPPLQDPSIRKCPKLQKLPVV